MTITDEIVEKVTEGLCGDVLAVIRTLSPHLQDEYRQSLYARTRRVLVDAMPPKQNP